jgi:hypothetical protein
MHVHVQVANTLYDRQGVGYQLTNKNRSVKMHLVSGFTTVEATKPMKFKLTLA